MRMTEFQTVLLVQCTKAVPTETFYNQKRTANADVDAYEGEIDEES